MRKTLAALTLSLGVAGCDPPAPAAVFRIEPIVVDGGPSLCPVVTGLSTGSLEALLGGEIELEAFASSQSELSFRWWGGHFDAPEAAITRYLCMYPGETVLSVALSKPECPEVVQRIAVTCTSERCSQCLEKAAASDLLARCTGGDYFDRGDTERCVDALVCALRDPGHCAADPDVGALACYCGERTRADCAKPRTARSGPAGACVAEWEAATRCKEGDARCVLDRFLDLGRPSGAASFTARAMAGDCSEACSPSLPAP